MPDAFRNNPEMRAWQTNPQRVPTWSTLEPIFSQR